jgi:hypothetical protein
MKWYSTEYISDFTILKWYGYLGVPTSILSSTTVRATVGSEVLVTSERLPGLPISSEAGGSVGRQ